MNTALLDVITDTVLEELERGANLPSSFAVYLPIEAWVLIKQPSVEIAGYRIFIRADGDRLSGFHS